MVAADGDEDAVEVGDQVGADQTNEPMIETPMVVAMVLVTVLAMVRVMVLAIVPVMAITAPPMESPAQV